MSAVVLQCTSMGMGGHYCTVSMSMYGNQPCCTRTRTVINYIQSSGMPSAARRVLRLCRLPHTASQPASSQSAGQNRQTDRASTAISVSEVPVLLYRIWPPLASISRPLPFTDVLDMDALATRFSNTHCLLSWSVMNDTVPLHIVPGA